ncbi:MAG: DUF3574 domain-containing protein [Rhodospirillales bacterium]
MRVAVAAAAAAALAACAPTCPAPLRPATTIELLFGRAIPAGGLVDEAAWARFSDEVVTPRFPDGYTVLDADGRYRHRDGANTITEPSKLMVIVTMDPAAALARAQEIAAEYRRRFAQESVLTTIRDGCAAF